MCTLLPRATSCRMISTTAVVLPVPAWHEHVDLVTGKQIITRLPSLTKPCQAPPQAGIAADVITIACVNCSFVPFH